MLVELISYKNEFFALPDLTLVKVPAFELDVFGKINNLWRAPETKHGYNK